LVTEVEIVSVPYTLRQEEVSVFVVLNNKQQEAQGTTGAIIMKNWQLLRIYTTLNLFPSYLAQPCARWLSTS